MKSRLTVSAALLCSIFLTSAFALAADQESRQERVQAQEQEHIYGSQMMTEQERNEYRVRMQEAKSDGERKQIRMEHHERMQERAKAQGLDMPDTPPPRGMGMGKGSGMGGGMGKGSGMGGSKGKGK